MHGVSDGRGRRLLRGCFAVSKGLLEEFGPERIRDTPLLWNSLGLALAQRWAACVQSSRS